MKKIPYKSLAISHANGEFIEKKSRFIGDLFLVHDEDEVAKSLSLIQKKHREATHVCYAYVLNEDIEKMKSSDNGEPQGTAGAPILNALQKNGLTNVLATVTRYFGGIKLGAGGLIRAYGKGVTVALEQAKLAIYDYFEVGSIAVSYSDHDALKYFLQQQEIVILKEDYEISVLITIQLKKEMIDNFEDYLKNRFKGKYTLQVLEEKILPQEI